MYSLLQLETLYLVPLLLSAIFSLKAFRQKWPKPYKLLSVLVVVSFLTDIIALLWSFYLCKMFSWHYSPNNLWIYNLFITLRLGMLLVIFYQTLCNKMVKRIIYIVGPVLLLFGIFNYLFIQGALQYNTYSVIFAHIPVIILCLCYFHQLLRQPFIIPLEKEPLVWVSLGIFIYHTVSLPFLIMLGFLNMQQSNLSMLFLPINDVLNLIMSISYLIAFLCKPTQMQPH